jgi:hypothetical protein
LHHGSFASRISGVYYEVLEEPELRVIVLAVGLKERNKVRMGRETVDI